GSSLDQVGLLARSVDDLGLMLSVIAGRDPLDNTSADRDFSSLAHLSCADLSKLKIALPKEFMDEQGLAPEVAAVFDQTCQWFRDRGAAIETVSIPVLEAAVSSYYVIALSEAASNLSRFDGIRYGLRKDPLASFDDLYVATRSDGFGSEVKRRIVIGNYVLSTHFSGDTYRKAMSVRARIQRDVAAVFEPHDILLCPTNPAPAFPLGSRVDDPIAMYLTDRYTAFVNLARIPSLSIPAGKTAAGLPVGVQICGPMGGEQTILEVARAREKSL
ncbi:MAG TPA: amidase family protein, partial [Treponemataceae bacterium]|nr:amidase family protein [Treponemataceae bacterium]